MIKRTAVAVLALLLLFSSTAYAIRPIDDEVMHYEEGPHEMTVEDVIAVTAELAQYTKEIEILAKLVWGEARGVDSTMEKAAVVWCVLNRVDDTEKYLKHDTIEKAATASYQFAYSKKNLICPELEALVIDVMTRWLLAKRGVEDVGRVLPSEYLWFASHGDGHNWFRKTDKGNGEYWDWSLPNPYKE